jgi:hypothetical protein
MKQLFDLSVFLCAFIGWVYAGRPGWLLCRIPDISYSNKTSISCKWKKHEGQSPSLMVCVVLTGRDVAEGINVDEGAISG